MDRSRTSSGTVDDVPEPTRSSIMRLAAHRTARAVHKNGAHIQRRPERKPDTEASARVGKSCHGLIYVRYRSITPAQFAGMRFDVTMRVLAAYMTPYPGLHDGVRTLARQPKREEV